jgi:hypothetical protein
MIKVNELRSGNFVQYKNMMFIPVIFIGFDSVELITPKGDTITAKLDEINPIPFCKEWLSRFGFSDKTYKRDYIGIDINHSDFVLTKPEVIGEWQKDFIWQFETGMLSRFVEIKHVHQFQNLFFALNSEELTFNCYMNAPVTYKNNSKTDILE